MFRFMQSKSQALYVVLFIVLLLFICNNLFFNYIRMALGKIHINYMPAKN